MGTSAVPVASGPPWSNGPWKRVRNTPSAFNNAPDELVSADNIYIMDTENGSGAFQRPGYDTPNLLTPFFADGAQCVFSHRDSGGTQYNFVISGGKIYRSDNNTVAGTWTDVTPAGTPISASSLVFALSSNGYLVINDEGNTPWIASSLASTPIVKTNIDFDGFGTAWRAKGQPVEYGGSVIFVLASVNSVACPTDIAWSAPGTPATGYEQNPYDFRWTLLASDSEQLNGLAATNLGLYYFRSHSIGVLTGTPATAGSQSGSDFRNSATQDAISAEVGCNASKTIQQFGTNIFFMDTLGRPWLLPTGPWVQQLGAKLVPLWQQMTSVLAKQATTDSDQSGQPTKTAQFAISAIIPVLGLYVCGNFTEYNLTGLFTYPTSLAVFNGDTGAYNGQWYIGSSPGNGLPIAAMGTCVFNTTNGISQAPMHTIIGGDSTVFPNTHSYLWAAGENGKWVDGSNGSFSTTDAVWCQVTTPRFGFDANLVQNVDSVGALVGTNDQVTFNVSTPIATATVAPTPKVSTDGTFRAIGGIEIMGRGVTVQVQRTNISGSSPNTQWSVQQVWASGVSSKAGPDDV